MTAPYQNDDGRPNGEAAGIFATLECELLDGQRFAAQADARLAVFDYIEGWCRGDPESSSLSTEPGQLRVGRCRDLMSLDRPYLLRPLLAQHPVTEAS